MNRRRFVVISASVGAAAAVAAGCAGRLGSPVSELAPYVAGRPGGKRYRISVQYALTQINGKVFRTRTYGGRIPGPTMVVRPGELLDVEIVNKLPRNPKERCPDGPQLILDQTDPMEDPTAMTRRSTHHRMATGPIDCMNNPHEFNSTNLHTHGIQTMTHLFEPLGTTNPAAPMISIKPGKTFRFPLPVPGNHPSGLHWYHPHHHGSTDVQVSNGMAGLIVVRGPIDEVPEIKAARELFLVIQSLQANKGKRRNLYEREPIAYKPPPKGYDVDTDYTMFTVSTDGTEGRKDATGVMWEDATDRDHPVYQPLGPIPTFTMQPGEIIRLRLLNGCNQHTLPLVLRNEATGDTMDVRQIAFDGVNLKAPKPIDMSGKLNLLGGLNVKNFIDAPVRMTVPGNRIEFLLKADKPGTYTLLSLDAADLHGPGTRIAFMQFIVAGPPKSMSFPSSLPLPEREYPFIEKPSAQGKTFTFSFKDKSNTILTGLDFLVNDEHYMEDVCPTTVDLNSTVEWRIENATGSIHPFHLHVNSFWLVAINDQKLAEPEIWDTFYVPPKRSRSDGKNGSITIRVRWLQWRGKAVHHCHFLSHEDTGMMQNFLIQ